MNYIDLFSGIGGFALGAYMAGMKFDKHYFSEVDPYCIELYQKRFPDAINLGDIRDIDCEKIMADANECNDRRDDKYRRFSESAKEIKGTEQGQDGERMRSGFSNGRKNDFIITGGFPCQDISIAGKGAGIRGERSGLWFEYWRIIRDLRPRYAIMENVGMLVHRGLREVLGSLAEIGYNAEWQDIRAEDVGAPHKRERIWIVAYAKKFTEREQADETDTFANCGKTRNESGNGRQYVSNPDEYGLADGLWEHGCRQSEKETSQGRSAPGRGGTWWTIEPAICGMADGLSDELDGYKGRLTNKSYKRRQKLEGLGNAIVPQIAMMLFQQIKPYMEER